MVGSYRDGTDSLTQEKMDAIFDAAREYNREHTRNTTIDAFGESTPEGEAYRALLDPLGNGIMGYIEIPDIDQRLVIYHGTSEEVLKKGCGHIAGRQKHAFSDSCTQRTAVGKAFHGSGPA